MDFIIEQLRFLGLRDREVKVFTALATFGRMNMTKISSRSGLPRTTVDAIVRRLVKQGLLCKEKVEGHTEYSVDHDDIAGKLDWIKKRIQPASDTESGSIKTVTEESLDVLMREMEKHKGDRVRLLFSRNGEDIDGCITRLTQYIEFATKAKIKMEILLGTEVADKVCVNGVAVSHAENLKDVQLNIVPASYGVAEMDMIVFSDVVLLFYIEKKSVERIEHQPVVETSKHLMRVACETGWSISLNAWLAEKGRV